MCRVLVAIALVVSCGSKKPNGFDANDAGAFGAGDDGGTLGTCPNNDCDKDGYGPPADCNDTDALIGPEAFDFVGDNIDNDCDGKADNPVETCETIPAQAPGAPADFARAADLCAQRSKAHSGAPFDPLVNAEWGRVRGYGPGQRLWTSETKPQQVNILTAFGQNSARRGLTMFGLSSGPWAARDPRASAPLDDSTFKLNDACADIPLLGTDCTSLSNGAPSAGLSVQDWAELALTIKVPANARTLAFDFAFYSTEFNQFWNGALNDAFFVLVTSSKFAGANVAKDASGFAITVNSGFFQLCPRAPGPAGLSPDKTAALAHCVGDDGDASQQVFGALTGTGYDGAGSIPSDGTAFSTDGTKKYVYGGGSGWLSSKFPVALGEQLTMRIIVHDTFDGLKDSAVIVDALRWEQAQSDVGVSRPPH